MIYFIQAGRNGPVKIGDSELVYDRLAQLQTANPYKLNILFVYNGRQYGEFELHDLFKHENIRGEWFRPARDIIGFNKKYPDDCFKMTNHQLYLCRESEEEVYWIKLEKWRKEMPVKRIKLMKF